MEDDLIASLGKAKFEILDFSSEDELNNELNALMQDVSELDNS